MGTKENTINKIDAKLQGNNVSSELKAQLKAKQTALTNDKTVKK